MPFDSEGIEYSAWLASAGLPSARMIRLIDSYGDPAGCYQAFQRNDTEFMEMISPRIREWLKLNGMPDRIGKMRQVMDHHGIRTIHIHDSVYPEKLKQISDPPGILFFQGNLSCLNQKILAMVGSRAASYHGQKATRKIAKDLSSRGVTIISGMASGIDTSAHTGCLEGGSPTVAVAGCGLDMVYPASNRNLRDRMIEQNGLLLSEYPPGEKPAGWHFPVRNRIITGLADALIVMEARIRSGSMTSVQLALEQGKDIFVYPGDPASEYYEGNHQLLREGGLYFTSAEDILTDLHWLDNPSPVRHNSDCSTEIPRMSANETAVINALKPGSLGFEKLVSMTGLGPSEMMSTLTILQIGGIIEALPGKQYQLKR